MQNPVQDPVLSLVPSSAESDDGIWQEPPPPKPPKEKKKNVYGRKETVLEPDASNFDHLGGFGPGISKPKKSRGLPPKQKDKAAEKPPVVRQNPPYDKSAGHSEKLSDWMEPEVIEEIYQYFDKKKEEAKAAKN